MKNRTKALAIRLPALLATSFVMALSFCGCSKEPLSSVLSSRPPASVDLVGTYVPDPGSLTTLLAQAGAGGTPMINLSMDGSVSITGTKELGLKELDGQNVKEGELHGTWDMGRNDEHWMILAESVEIFIVGDKPPYALELKVGKPGRERILRFERQMPGKP